MRKRLGYRIFFSSIKSFIDCANISSYFRKRPIPPAISLHGRVISLNSTKSFDRISENYCTYKLRETNSITNMNSLPQVISRWRRKGLVRKFAGFVTDRRGRIYLYLTISKATNLRLRRNKSRRRKRGLTIPCCQRLLKTV